MLSSRSSTAVRLHTVSCHTQDAHQINVQSSTQKIIHSTLRILLCRTSHESTHPNLSNIKLSTGGPKSIIRGGIFLSSRSGNILNEANLNKPQFKQREGKGGIITVNQKRITEKKKKPMAKATKKTNGNRKRSHAMSKIIMAASPTLRLPHVPKNNHSLQDPIAFSQRTFQPNGSIFHSFRLVF